MNDTTKKAMTLEQVRDELRSEAKNERLGYKYGGKWHDKLADAIDAHLSAQREGDFETTYHGVLLRKMVEMLRNNEWADLFTGVQVIADLQAEISRLHAPIDGEAVLYLRGVDEYGPMLDWYKPWTDYKAGTKFYTATPHPRVGIKTEALATLAKLARHADDCMHATPLPTGEGNWHCTCSLDSYVLDGEPLDYCYTPSPNAVTDEMVERAYNACDRYIDEHGGDVSDIDDGQWNEMLCAALEAALSEKGHGVS